MGVEELAITSPSTETGGGLVPYSATGLNELADRLASPQSILHPFLLPPARELKVSSPMAANRERTFIMVKPDGVQRGLVGKIIKRFESKGFKLVALKFTWIIMSYSCAKQAHKYFFPQPSEELLKKHYADLSARPFFNGLVKYMSSGPVVPMVWEGLNVVKTGRVMLGATDPKDSAPGTIRGDLCIQVGRNILHGSDSVESAKKEIDLWFSEKEVVSWQPAVESWVYED
uniref:Nucleoside diphosphate kinase n=3 Tax=Timema TaxID=61471 RepID=A0A7R9DFQ6_TIMPO|nr:unnamed protein product [Timema poppensis]